MKFRDIICEDVSLTRSERSSIFGQIPAKFDSLEYGEYYVAHVTDDFENTCRFVLIEFLGTPDCTNRFRAVRVVSERDVYKYNYPIL